MLGNTKHLVTLAVKLWCHNGLQLHTMMIRVIRMLCASLMEEREEGKKGEREEGKEGRKEGGREGRKEGAHNVCERVNKQKLHEPGKLYTAASD